MTRILIVDDKEENLFLLRCLLESQDCTVDCAHDGAEALVKARHSPPDLIISDLLMPVMDGYTLLRHWKNDVRLKKVPFIIYTATYTDPEDERLALSMGADAFILKPANPEDFLTTVREVQAKSVAAVPAVQNVPAGDEKEVLRAYSQTLVRKLEEKTSQLEESNRALQRDVAAREKAEQAQRRMAETQMGILNALPAHIALLDLQGVIVAVNEAWRRFASANVLQSSDFYVGHNYLGICESAHGECADEARAVASGIRKVLGGEAQDFAIEYPCHSPTEQRWFRLMVTPLSETQRTGVVVMHINVTERRAAEEILSQKEREQRRLAEELTVETHRLHESQAVANVGSWETDLATLDVTWTEETFRIFETSPEEFTPTHQGFLERIHPEDRQKVDDAFKRSLGEQGPFAIEHRLLFPDGRIKFVEERWQAFHDATGRSLRALGTCQDITQRKMAEDLIRIRVRQQETIAKIGFEATRATTLEGIFDFATRAVAEALDVELCKVLQLAPDGSYLRLVSGVGWQAGLIGVCTVGVDRESQAGFTLQSDGPIYVNDLAKETRFISSPLLQQHEVVSGLSVNILLRDKPWGVLSAHCRTVRSFNGADSDFMQTVATLLAVVIERLAVQRTLTESEARMRDAQRIAHLGNWEVDLATNKVNWSEEAFRIFGAETENFSPSYEAFLTRVHPNDLEAMRAAHENAVSGKGPLEIEHRIIRGDGAVRVVRERGELIHDENGAPVALSGTVLDITDLRAAQSRAERMNALLNEAQRIADMGSWEMDLATGRLLWPEETCRLFGIQPGAFGGTFEEFIGFILPEDRPAYSAIHAKITPTAPLLEAEYRIRRPDGTVRWMFERGIVTFDSAGKVTRRLGVVMDITGRRKNEEQLRLLETCVSRLNDIVLITEAEPIDDPGPRILYVNDAFVRRTGFSREEAIGKTPRILQGPKTQRDALDRIRAALKAWKPVREELINYTKSGEEFWLELDIVPVADATGWFTHWVAIERDITERKQAEDQLRKLSQAVEQSPAAIIVTDLAGNIEYVNPKFTESTGYTAEEVIGKNPRILNSGKNPPELYREMWATITAGKTWRGEMHNRKKNGETYWELAAISPVLNATGKATHYLGLKEDITERRKNEAQLRLLETCVSRLNDIVLITEAEPIDDPGPRILYVNDAFVRRTGFSREEAIGKTPRLLQGPKTQRDALDRIRAALKAWKPVREELINYTKSGEEFWLELEIVPVADATGWFTHWVSIERDITERKHAQEALAASQRQYRDLVETSVNVIWTVDVEGRFTFVNQASRAVFGRDPDEMIGHRFHEFVPEDQHQANDEVLARMLQDGQDTIDYSNRIRRKDGSIAILNSNARIVRDSQGRMIGISGMSQDTTEVVRAQEAIAQSEARFRGLFDQAAVGMSIKSAEGIFLRTNERFCEIVGYSAEELLRHAGIELTHPDDREREAQTVAGMLAGELQTASWEKRYLHKAGHAVWCNLTLSLLPGGSGQPRQFVGVIEDITERRAAVEQLRHREQLLRIAGKVARMGGWSVDFPEVRITWSDEVCAIHDMPAGTVPTLEQGLGFYSPESRPVIESAFSLCAREGTPFDVEVEVVTAKGRRIWVRSIGQAERDSAGAIRRVQGAFQDISEQKAAELEIIRTNRALKMLSTCNEALIHAEEERVLLDEICQIAVLSGGYRMAWVGYAQEDAKRTIKPVAHAGEEAGYLSEVAITWEENTLEGSGPAGRTIRTGQPNMSEDIEQDADFHWRDVARQRGYRSVICLPLRGDNRTFGLLGLYSPEVLQASAEEIKLLQELADDLAFGIGHLRARRESERIHSVVTKVATAVSASTGTEFFEQLAHNLAEALGACSAFVTEFLPEKQITACTLGAVVDGKIVENFEYLLEGTPCENLATSETFVVEGQAAAQFPAALRLAALGAQAYVGKRLDDSTGRPLGHLCVIFREPLKQVQFVTSTMQIFAARAASELERRQTDAQLREQAALLDAAHEAIQLKDMEGRITYWNKGAERTYGWTAAEVLGRKAGELLYANQARFQEVFASVLERETWAGEMERLTNSGHSITVESRWTLVHDHRGRPKSILVIATDLTERRRAEKEQAQAREAMLVELERRVEERTKSLSDATQEAERANRAKSEFLSRMSHELRTPLHAILGYAQLMEMDERDPEEAEGVAQIVRAGNHLLGLINEVLDIARVESGRLALTPEPVNVREILEEALSLLKPQAAQRGVRLEPLAGEADCEVLSNEQRLKQVILNLLSNAVKFNREGGSVAVSCERREDRVRISVTDTGRGISPENLGKLFVPFERLDVGDTVIEGTGLGLALSKHLIEAMGGRIGVTSTLGEGSTFAVELPLSEATPTATERSLGEPASSTADLPRPTTARTVLYIEDNLSNSRLVERILARRPEVKLISAMQGSLGLELARQHRPELVLLDLHLPDMAGDEILRQLRADPHTAHLRIVIISADATAPQIERLRELGATDYLTKPIDVRKFLALIDATEARDPQL